MKKIVLASTGLLLTLALAGCGSSSFDSSKLSSLKNEVSSLKAENSSLKSNSTESTDDSNASSSSEENSKSESFGLNESATTSDSDGNPQVGIKFTSVTKQFDAHGQGLVGNDIDSLAISNEKSVQFTVNYTNEGQDESFLPSLDDFAVYDANGTAGTIVNQQEGQTEVSKGHSANTTFWVNFDSAMPKGSKIEVEWSPEDTDGSAKFDLTVN